MSKVHSIAAKRAAIEKTAHKLFSAGPLSKKTTLALDLAGQDGLDLYSTGVPWNITLPKDQIIEGYSETLRTAAQDIYSNLVIVGKDHPADTEIIIDIDEARLPKPKQKALVKKLEGG